MENGRFVNVSNQEKTTWQQGQENGNKVESAFLRGFEDEKRDGSIAAFSDGRAMQKRLQSLHIWGIRKLALHIPPSVVVNPQN